MMMITIMLGEDLNKINITAFTVTIINLNHIILLNTFNINGYIT